MKAFQKLTALTLAAVFTLSLAACATPGTVGETTGGETAEDRLANFNETGLPIVNEPIELSVITMRWGDHGDSFTQNQWLVDLEENTNVNIDWQVKSSNDWNEQRSILFAGGEMPDIFLGNETIRDTDVINNLEYFLPLDDLIDKYMPNYKKALEMYPEMREMTTYPDGKIYTLSKNLPARAATRNHPVINKKWLDDLDLEVPATVDELTDVLKAFVDNNASGLSQTYGISWHISNDNGGLMTDFLAPFGITEIYTASMSMLDGEPFYYPTSDRFRQGLEWLNELYTLGVYDPESFTQDESTTRNKHASADGPMVGFSYQWTPDSIFGAWGDQYIAIPPLTGPDGNKYISGDPNGIFAIMRNEAAITVDCENPEAAARWLDQFYTNEASIQNFWGAIGTVISANEDGTFTLNNPPEGTSADAWYWEQSLRDFGPKFVEPEFNEKIILDPTAGDGFKLEISKETDPFVTDPFPQLLYTIDEQEEITLLESDINSYRRQAVARFITEGVTQEGWDEYLQRLSDMGVDRLVEIRIAAYDRMKGE